MVRGGVPVWFIAPPRGMAASLLNVKVGDLAHHGQMKGDTTEYLLGSLGYAIAIAGAYLATAFFFEGVTSVPDSFLGNLVSVDGIAVGVLGVAVPVAVRLLGPGDPINRFFGELIKGVKNRTLGRLSSSVLLKSGVFASVVPSPLSLVIDSVVSLSVSIFLALYAILHADAVFPSFVAFLLFMFGVILLLEVTVAIAAVYRARRNARSGPEAKDTKPE